MANNYAVYRVTRCCNSGETGFFSVAGILPGLIPPNPGQEVFVYGGASNITLTDANGNVVIFESGECYTIETTTQSTGFTFVVDLLASDFTSVNDCIVIYITSFFTFFVCNFFRILYGLMFQNSKFVLANINFKLPSACDTSLSGKSDLSDSRT